MALGTEKIAETFLSVVANTPIDCDWPLYATDEVEVIYGSASLTAVPVTDYTVALSPPDYDQFTITPKASLLTKINNLISANPTEEINYITVRRVLDYKTSVTPESVRGVAFLSREVERIHMRFQQLSEIVARCVRFPRKEVGGIDADAEIEGLDQRANKALVFDSAGNMTVSEDDYNDQEAAVSALAAAAAASAATATTQAGVATTQAGVATTQANNAAASASSAASTLTSVNSAGATQIAAVNSAGATQIALATAQANNAAASAAAAQGYAADAQDAVLAAGTYYRNIAINGEASVFKRDDGLYADGAYAEDGWYVLCQTGSVTVSRIANPESGKPTGVRYLQPDSTAKRIGMAHPIESFDVVPLRGAPVSLKFRLRANANADVRYAIIGHTGTADAITRDVVNNWGSGIYTPGSFFISGVTILGSGLASLSGGVWTDVTVGSIVIPSNINNVILFAWTVNAQAQNFALDRNDCVFNAGSSLITRPVDIRQTIIACERLLPGLSGAEGNIILMGGSVSNNTSSFVVPFNVRARKAVTGLISTTAGWFTVGNGVNVGGGATSINLSLGGFDGARLLVTSVAGTPTLTPGDHALLYSVNPGAKLIFTGGEL